MLFVFCWRIAVPESCIDLEVQSLQNPEEQAAELKTDSRFGPLSLSPTPTPTVLRTSYIDSPASFTRSGLRSLNTRRQHSKKKGRVVTGKTDKARQDKESRSASPLVSAAMSSLRPTSVACIRLPASSLIHRSPTAVVAASWSSSPRLLAAASHRSASFSSASSTSSSSSSSSPSTSRAAQFPLWHRSPATSAVSPANARSFPYTPARNMATAKRKIQVKNPVVEMDGDEVSVPRRVFWSLHFCLLNISPRCPGVLVSRSEGRKKRKGKAVKAPMDTHRAPRFIYIFHAHQLQSNENRIANM